MSENNNSLMRDINAALGSNSNPTCKTISDKTQLANIRKKLNEASEKLESETCNVTAIANILRDLIIIIRKENPAITVLFEDSDHKPGTAEIQTQTNHVNNLVATKKTTRITPLLNTKKNVQNLDECLEEYYDRPTTRTEYKDVSYTKSMVKSLIDSIMKFIENEKKTGITSHLEEKANISKCDILANSYIDAFKLLMRIANLDAVNIGHVNAMLRKNKIYAGIKRDFEKRTLNAFIYQICYAFATGKNVEILAHVLNNGIPIKISQHPTEFERNIYYASKIFEKNSMNAIIEARKKQKKINFIVIDSTKLTHKVELSARI